MAGVIQYGALRLDVMVDTKGVRALRTDMAALTRVLNDAKGPAGSFERNITRLTVAQQEGKISAQQQKEVLDAIIQRYLKSAKTTAEYMAALAHVKQVLPGMSTEVSRLALAHRREQRETEASAKAAEEAAIRKRRAAQYNKRLIADAVAEAEKAERQAERAARKAAREAEARRQENKRVRDSVMQMAAGHNRATQQIIADLNLLENARRKGRIATFHIVEAEKNQLEAYLRGQRGPRQLAAAVQSLTALYPQHAATIQMILTKLQQEAAAEKATADAKRAAVRAKKDADAQQKADMAAMTALNVKARGEAGKLLSQLEALARIQKSGAASQQSINSAMKQAARDYFANAKSVKDLVDMKQKLNNLTKEEMQAVRAAMSVRAKEITDLERTTTANRNAAKEKRENERAQKFLNQVIREGMSPTEQIAAKEQRLNQLLAQGRINAQQYGQALASLKSQMQNLNKETSLATQLFTRFLSLAFAKELGQRALAFRNDSINAFMDLRDSIIKLEVILGDAAEASKLYQQLRQIAVQSNQTSDAVIRSAVTMAQFGVSASNLAPAMERITQIAAGNAERLQSLSLAYAQVAAAGRLTGQETLQFVNAGFSPLAEIARTTGKDMRTLRKEMEEGLITFDMVTESLITATSEGGRFAGMNLKLSKELSGSMSRYNDGFKRLQESIGALSEMRAIIDLLAESFKSLAEKLDQFNQGAAAFFRNRTMTAIDFLREQERIDKLPFAFRDSIEQRNRQIGRGFFGQDVDRFTQQELDAAREDLRREREKSRTAGGQAFGIGSLAERDARTPAAMERERLRVEQERIAEMREKITQLLTDVQEGATTDLDRFFELRAKLDFAVSDGIIGIAESQRILAEASAPLIGLREQELTQMERARAEYDRMLAFYQAGAISLDQFNAHYLAFKDELNKPFLDKAKEVREALKTPAERDAEQVRELAALINAGMITQQEATKFLAQQAQENIKAIQTDLPQGVSFGTREAYELMNRVNNQIQTGQLQVARQQLIEQKKAADLLKEIAAKPDIGIVN